MLDKISNLNQKGVFVILIAFILLLNTCGQRSLKREVTKTKAEVDSLQTLVDNLYSKEEMDKRMKIQSLEQEKSTLFNVNYIVLTKQRPDFRMNEIDKQIDSLETKLK